MPFITKKNENLVGIDFGSGAIKIVELANRAGTVELITYGLGIKNRVTVKTDAVRNRQTTVEQLVHVMKESRVTTKRVVAALPAVNVFTTVVTMPPMPKKEIDDAIRWEAKKMVPLPLDKMSIDWHPVTTPTTGDGSAEKITIIMTAAPTDVIKGYMDIFRSANLQLVGLETEATALRRSLLPIAHGCHLLLDIGATTSNVTIFDQGLPVVTRNIDIGGEAISRNIANAMNISVERADQFRDDIGLPLTGQSTHPVHQAITFVIDNLILQELSRVLNTYTAGGGQPLDRIIIVGGCSRIKNLSHYIQLHMKITVEAGDPWQSIRAHAELAPELEKIAPQMAVAIGLALKVKYAN
ncbi:MAG: type IV pilus assembly protein PilM [Patescibacteria group bacterium]